MAHTVMRASQLDLASHTTVKIFKQGDRKVHIVTLWFGWISFKPLSFFQTTWICFETEPFEMNPKCTLHLESSDFLKKLDPVIINLLVAGKEIQINVSVTLICIQMIKMDMFPFYLSQKKDFNRRIQTCTLFFSLSREPGKQLENYYLKRGIYISKRQMHLIDL